MPPDPQRNGVDWRPAWRLALAMALSLTVAEARDLPFAFLVTVFAVQMLTKSPQPPTLKQGIGFAVVMAITAEVALSLCNLLIHRPVAYLLAMGVVFALCFYLQARGKGGPLPQLLLICNATLPVLAAQSADLAMDFANIMVGGALAAPLIAWLVHALFPQPAGMLPAAPPPPAANPAAALRRAALATLVLLLPFAQFMARPDDASFVVLMTIIGVMTQVPEMRGKIMIGLLLGNLIGGIAATIAFSIVTLLPVLSMLFLLTLLAGLVLGGRLYGGAPMAPVFGVALTTFVILFGLGLAPVGDSSGDAFVSRLIDVALTSLYAVGAIALFAAGTLATRQIREVTHG